MREMVRDYTDTGKYKSENIQSNQFMERNEKKFFDKNAIVLTRMTACMILLLIWKNIRENI